MKSLADFTKKSKVAEANITRDKFYKNEVYKKGEWVLTEQGQVGKIHRRGPNYVLCLTAENTKFRSWITDIKEVFEIGTDAYREYVMSITPGQKVQKPKNTVKVPETIPSKHPTNKMDKHESKSLAQVAAETMLNPKFKSMKETWRYDYSAKIGNTDIKGLGAKGVGGPSVLLKAIQEGATVLDAYAVPSKKFPSGFLPQLYNDFGFVELGRIKFDPQYYTKQEVADLKAYWRSTGWDESMGLPEVAIMKWKGDNAIRPDATRYFIEQGGIGAGPKATGGSAAAAQSYGQRAGKSAGTTQRSGILSNAGGNTGSIRASNRTPVPQRVRGVLSETVNLSPSDASAYGLDPQRIQRVGAKFPSLLSPY